MDGVLWPLDTEAYTALGFLVSKLMITCLLAMLLANILNHILCLFNLGNYFGVGLKTISSRPSVEDFPSKLSRAEQQKLQESSKGMYSKQTLPDGRIRVTGGKRLKASGHYTAGFGKHVANLLLKQKLKVTLLNYYISSYYRFVIYDIVYARIVSNAATYMKTIAHIYILN